MANETGNGESVDLASLGSFDFAPSWVAGNKVVSAGGGRDAERDSGRGRFHRDGEKRDSGDKPFRPKNRAPRHDSGFRPQQKRAPVRPLDAEVRILPGQKELGGIIRKMQTGHAAYPIKQIAFFFLQHPEACRVKVTPKDGETKFHVCKTCGYACLGEDALCEHIVSAHLADYYTCEEIEKEPPSGQFGCVVKCGVTGEFIGPPNLHGYGAKIAEMARRLGMDEDLYRSKLVTLRDNESIEAWRAGATKKTVYRLKAAEGAEPGAPVERDVAEMEFRRDILPQLKTVSRSSDSPLDAALKSTELPYLFAVRDAVARERRFPASLLYALRGAFHYRKFEFFRADDARGQEFACSVKPSPLDTEHAIPELGAVVDFVKNHPHCRESDLPEEMKGHFGWLVEKGHIIKYFNGTLALPGRHPVFAGGSRAAEPAGDAGAAKDAQEESAPTEAKEGTPDENPSQLAE